jgi:hypothetical protein
VTRATNPRSIASDTLQALVKRGAESDVLRARQQYAEADGFHKYVKPLVAAGVERVHPDMMPTQASGRWSTKNPPLVNWPDDAKAEQYKLPKLRRLVVPDEGTWWLSFDWSAMHARIMAAACNDLDDLRAFRDGLDLHTITACRVFKLPLPRDLRTPGNDAEWVAAVKWAKGDRRRHLMKTVRYALLNGLDERSVLEAKDVERQGLTYDELVAAGRQFLRAKPAMPAWKRTFTDGCLKARVSRSAILGRRRMLYGPENDQRKAAISHFLQGTEVDVMELTLCETLEQYRDARLAYTSHDGIKLVFPDHTDVAEAWSGVRAIAERPYTILNNVIAFTADWEVIRPDGSHTPLGG